MHTSCTPAHRTAHHAHAPRFELACRRHCAWCTHACILKHPKRHAGAMYTEGAALEHGCALVLHGASAQGASLGLAEHGVGQWAAEQVQGRVERWHEPRSA